MYTISASVVPAIMGRDPYTDKLGAWMKITKRAPQEPQSEAARIGEHLERYAVEWLQTQHGIAIADTQVHTSVDVTDQWRMYARLDAITDDGTPVEIKTTREYDGRLPDTWYLQIQAQLIAAQRDYVMLVVVSRADAVTTLEVVEADAATQRSIIDECDKFCVLHLATDSPPYSSNVWTAAEAASALGYSESIEVGESTAARILELRSEYKRLSQQLNEIKEQLDEIAAATITVDRAVRLTHNGRVLGSLVAPRERESIDADKLKIIAPDIYEQVRKTSRVKPYWRWS
ncbi:MAG: hypothetical protein KatS3mg038_1179 [Candidatus Kapaibacterium sp.]|nr:MAG: hypothetical protein KatS3mg038_1179 [Candidatus Kapabacteria bacterium]